MEIAATLNPVTYVMEAMRSVILTATTGWSWARDCSSLRCSSVATLSLNARMMRHYD